MEANQLLVVLGVLLAASDMEGGGLATVTKMLRRVAVQRRKMVPVWVQRGQRERQPEVMEVDMVERGSKEWFKGINLTENSSDFHW